MISFALSSEVHIITPTAISAGMDSSSAAACESSIADTYGTRAAIMGVAVIDSPDCIWSSALDPMTCWISAGLMPSMIRATSIGSNLCKTRAADVGDRCVANAPPTAVGGSTFRSTCGESSSRNGPMNGSSHLSLEPGFTSILIIEAASVWLRTEQRRAPCVGEMRQISLSIFDSSAAPIPEMISRNSVAVRSTMISPASPAGACPMSSRMASCCRSTSFRERNMVTAAEGPEIISPDSFMMEPSLVTIPSARRRNTVPSGSIIVPSSASFATVPSECSIEAPSSLTFDFEPSPHSIELSSSI